MDTNDINSQSLFDKANTRYPIANGESDGRLIIDNVPNLDSISASLLDYRELPKIREVPLSDFSLSGTSYSVSENKRIKELAEQIRQSNKITPLIVVIDYDGPYILEGGHRAEALFLLGAKYFPAVVVVDLEDDKDIDVEAAAFKIIVKTASSDEEYMAAVKSGNIESAQKMVDEAAKSWGAYTENGSPKIFYHTTNNEFTIFNRGVRDGLGGKGIYFSDWCMPYGKNTIAAYLKIENPMTRENQPRGAREVNSSGIETKIISDFFDIFPQFDAIIGRDEYVIKNPDQIKLAAPVTYDDSGNIIPLSQRFDPGSPDIRFEENVPIITTANFDVIVKTSSTTNITDSPTFKSWFGNSKVVDKNGKPLIVYHGSQNNISKFNVPSYFSESENEAGAYANPVNFKEIERLRSKYSEASGKQYAGQRFPSIGIFSDIPRTEREKVWATDQGVGIVHSNGKITIFNDIVIEKGSYDIESDTVRVIKGWSDAYKSAVNTIEDFIKSRYGKRTGEGGSVYPVYLSIQNPKEMSPLSGNRFSERLKMGEEEKATIEKLKAQGYDGIFTESDEAAVFPEIAEEFGGRVKQYVPFYSYQIKSAIGNRGDFNKENTDITAGNFDLIIKTASTSDEEYMKAVEAKDIQTCQKMIDEAAKASGYTIQAYHGTRSEDKFTIFHDNHNNKQSQAPAGTYFFSSDRDVAYSYSGRSDNIIKVFLKIDNPFYFDFMGADWQGDLYGKVEADKDGDIRYFETEKDAHNWLIENGVEDPDKYIRKDPWVGHSTNSVVVEAKQDGHDGAVMDNVIDNGSYSDPSAGTIYVVFSSNQVKSAEPIVKDDQGNVITLSRRFDLGSPDIRFEEDAPVIKEASANNSGEIIAYHGTPYKFETFSSEFMGSGEDMLGSGFYFTSNKDNARRFAFKDDTIPNQDNAIFKVKLDIKNPLDADKVGTIPRGKIIKLLKLSPNFKESLNDFGDIEFEGVDKVFQQVVDNFYEHCNGNVIVRGLFAIANDFYRDKPKEFNDAVTKVLGYDGVIKHFQSDAFYGDVIHYVAFRPDQIQVLEIEPQTRTSQTNFEVIVKTSQEEDYRGNHQAPDHTSGYPLHDLSGIYPDDIYGENGARYYGQGNPLDSFAVNVMKTYRGRPNAQLQAYRAVPNFKKMDETIEDLEAQKRYIQKYGKIPNGVEPHGENRSRHYDWLCDEIERRKLLPPVEKTKLSINVGDWVTTVREYAKEHGESTLLGKYKILSKTVYARDLFTTGDSIFEFGYDPQPAVPRSRRQASFDVVIKTALDHDDTKDEDPIEFFRDKTIQALRDTGFSNNILSNGGVLMYHGTSARNAKLILRQGKFNGFPFFSPDRNIAKNFASQAGENPTVIDFVIDPSAILPISGSNSNYFSARMSGLMFLKNTIWGYQNSDVNRLIKEEPIKTASFLNHANNIVFNETGRTDFDYAEVTLHRWGKSPEVYIYELRSHVKGGGSKILNQLTQWADDNGFRLIGDARAMKADDGVDALSQEDLIKFYQKYGFSVDKNNKFSRNPQSNSRQITASSKDFDSWFAGSKVVDADGNPLIMHHGTDRKFTVFDKSKTYEGIFWFTSDRDLISRGEIGANGSGHIMDAYLSIKNPAGWDEYDKFSLGQLFARGYDGAILPEDGQITCFVFEPEQIKLVSEIEQDEEPILAKSEFDILMTKTAFDEQTDSIATGNEAWSRFYEISESGGKWFINPIKLSADKRNRGRPFSTYSDAVRSAESAAEDLAKQMLRDDADRERQDLAASRKTNEAVNEIADLNFPHKWDDSTKVGDLMERVVWDVKRGQDIETNPINLIGVKGKSDVVRGVHIGDSDYWRKRLRKDYGRGRGRVINIVVANGDRIVEDNQYMTDPDTGEKADSAVLLTGRKTLKYGVDWVFANEDFANKTADLDILMIKIASSSDEEYMKAAEAGDMKTCQKMIDTEANEALKDMRDRWRSEGVSSFAYASNGDIKLSEIQMPKSQRGQGLGTQKMQELINFAQKHSMRIILSPSTSFGASSKSRLEHFYSNLGFVKNSGSNKDYRISETMIWRPNGYERSSNPIMRDSSGEIIPLSRMFTDNIPNVTASANGLIKISSSDDEYMKTVEAGDMATAQKMVDEAAKRAGYTVEAWHGTDGQFNEFSHQYTRGQMGFHFGTKAQAESIYGDENPDRLFKVLLKISNPLRLEDLGGWQGRDVVAMVNKATGSSLNPSSSDSSIRAAIIKAGYDSVVYVNSFETPPEESGTGNNDSYIVFSPARIKSAAAVTRDDQGNVIPLSKRFNSSSSDIRFKENAPIITTANSKMSNGERTFYRGTVPGETRHIKEPFDAARGKTFVARKEESARNYGSDIETIIASPNAKILREEDSAFWRLIGRRRPPNGYIGSALRNGETMIEAVNDAIRKAEQAGYDIISFSSDTDIGTVILNEASVTRQSKPNSLFSEKNKPSDVSHKEDFQIITTAFNIDLNDKSKKAIENTPGAKITEDGIEIDVERNQHPDQSGKPSARSGVFYQPSGSFSKYPYSGKQGYGGLERIKKTLRLENPIFVKGATGGKAPEAAYNFIVGKGSYEKMKDDVYKRVISPMFSHNVSTDYLKLITGEVLENYGGDKTLADHIIETFSKRVGNGLTYAIVENIVANVVKKAGYDAIVGYSIRRDGTPFLSEVFYLNEQNYPQKIEQQAANQDGLNKPTQGLLFDIKNKTEYDVTEEYYTNRDEAVSEFLQSFKNHKGRGKWLVPWSLIPAAKLIKIWNDYAKFGFVRDEKGMDSIAGQMIKNVARLDATNAISGHDMEDMRQTAEEAFGYKFTDKQWDKFVDGMEDESGNWRVSDFGLPQLQKLAFQLGLAKTPEQQLVLVDQMLNVVHQRGDLSAQFIEGGEKTLNQLFAGSTTEASTEFDIIIQAKLNLETGVDDAKAKGHLDTQLFPDCAGTKFDRDVVGKYRRRQKNKDKHENI